jgi:hypothetical protein
MAPIKGRNFRNEELFGGLELDCCRVFYPDVVKFFNKKCWPTSGYGIRT